MTTKEATRYQEYLTSLDNRDLVRELIGAVKDAEFWSEHGRHGDGHLETAIRERNAVKKELLKRLEGVK